MRAIVAATMCGVVLRRRQSPDPRMMRPAIRNAVAIAALVASLGSAGVLLVEKVAAGANAQPPYIERQTTALD